MSLHPRTHYAVPAETIRVAHACFRHGHPSLLLAEALGTLFDDQAFVDLLPTRGQPAVAPGRLALVTLLPCAERLPDRHAADAVRSRIDWKYLLGLALTDPGFAHTILSECRGRLVAHEATSRLFDIVLERLQARGLITARGRQRSDSTRSRTPTLLLIPIARKPGKMALFHQHVSGSWYDAASRLLAIGQHYPALVVHHAAPSLAALIRWSPHDIHPAEQAQS